MKQHMPKGNITTSQRNIRTLLTLFFLPLCSITQKAILSDPYITKTKSKLVAMIIIDIYAYADPYYIFW